MYKLICCKIIFCIMVFFTVISCSTTRVIPEGRSRLAKNKIIVSEPTSVSPTSLQHCLKQKPNNYFLLGWNPFLNVYNWSTGTNSWWDRFVKKIGNAPVLFDPTLVKMSEQNIENQLIHNGYYNSTVTDSITTHNKKTKVLYDVKLGKRYVIDSIVYSIADNGLKHLYFSNTTAPVIKTGDFLSEGLLEDEVKRVTSIFRNNGYFNFNGNYFSFVADTLQKNGRVKLEICVNNYLRNESKEETKPHKVYRFGNVYLNPVRNLQPVFGLSDSLSVLKKDTVRYKNVNIIYSGKKPLIRPKVLERMNLIVPGNIYDERLVEKTYKRYSYIKMFSSINIDASVPSSDTTAVDLNIKLLSSALQGYKLSLEGSSNSSGLFGISPGLSYYHKNIFGDGEVFNVSFTGNFQFKPNDNVHSNEFGISSSISIPNFLFINDNIFKGGIIPSTELSISYNYQQRPEYTRNIISGSFGYSWSVRNKLFYKINLIQANVVKLYNLSESFYESLKDPFLKNSYQNHFDLGVGGSLYYTTDASTPHKNSYFYLRWNNDLSGNLLSLFNNTLPKNSSGEYLIWNTPYSQYFRTELSAVYTWIFGREKKQGLAIRALAGIGKGYGNSISLPFEKLFWAGGAYDIRGWQARTIGPGASQADTTFRIPNQTGNMKLEANIEYRFPLFWIFDGAVFVDAGNVWMIKTDSDKQDKSGLFHFNNFYRQIAMSTGAGLRLNLGFTILRLDMGLKTYDPSIKSWIGPNKWFRNDNYTIQFGIEYPF